MPKRYHLIIDASGCESKIITKSKLDDVIMHIAKLCNMKIIYGPIVVKGSPSNPGFTAFAIIDSSHISIHSFAAQNALCIDIFSCKAFDCTAVTNYIKAAFNLDERHIKSQKIGNNWRKDTRI